ncbi:uncharacterized protein LOC135496312 [Lineus longissimus]|uniref:uncharacterized protein LOC135496312 n=1 Tax=Lineus longissimus TaxID=88925 RepID=UPI002B4E682A
MIRELVLCVALGLFAVGLAQEDGGGGAGPDEGDANVPKVWDDGYAKKQMDKYYTYHGVPEYDHGACLEKCEESGEGGADSSCVRRCGEGYKNCLRKECRGDGTKVATTQPRCYWWHGCRRRMCKGEEKNGVEKGPNCPDLPL